MRRIHTLSTIFKIGAMSGLGITQSNWNFSYTNDDYNYSTQDDVDYDNYIRHYQDLTLNQKIKLLYVNIPIYADIAYHVNRSLGLYADVGVRLNLNVINTVEEVYGHADIFGVYPQYNQLRLDGHWGYNGFGYKSYTKDDLVSEELLDFNKFTMDVFGGLGVRYNIPNVPLSIDLGINYVMGLTNVLKTSEQIGVNSAGAHVVFNAICGGFRESSWLCFFNH